MSSGRSPPGGVPPRSARCRAHDPLIADPVAAAARRYRSDRVRLADLTRFICDASRCYPVVGGALVHKDRSHMTTVFARSLWPYLNRRVERLLRG